MPDMATVFLHDPAILDDGELPAVKALCPHWSPTETILDVNQGDLVIARHTVWPWPKRVDRDVTRLGGTLLNGLRQYAYCDSPLSWSWDLGDLTPTTYTDFSHLPDDGRAFIVKGAKATKSLWSKMYAPTKRAAIDLMIEMHGDPRYEGQEIVARDYVPLERQPGWDERSCPPSTEFRVFVLDGKIMSKGFYWFLADDDHSVPPAASSIPEVFLAKAISRISGKIRFYTLDVAKTRAGDWIVIEVTDGQRAGLSHNDPETLYGNMGQLLRQ